MVKIINDLFSADLLKTIEDLSISIIDNAPMMKFRPTTNEEFEYYTGMERLKECMADPYTHIKSTINNKANTNSTNKVGGIISALCEAFPDKLINQSGDFLYGKDNGFMSWHTNADSLYTRIYFSYSETGDSFFRYYHNGEIHTSQDMKGVTVRMFDVDLGNDSYLWHCVGAHCYRTSFGFRVIDKYAQPIK